MSLRHSVSAQIFVCIKRLLNSCFKNLPAKLAVYPFRLSAFYIVLIFIRPFIYQK